MEARGAPYVMAKRVWTLGADNVWISFLQVSQKILRAARSGTMHRSRIPVSAPETIGHYRIESKLGEGGMGAVYRATDSKLNRDVAINPARSVREQS